MPSHYGSEANPVQPAQDHNIQTPAAQSTGTANPPIPADHVQQTPEFLQKLIRQLNSLRQAQSDLFAQMYAPHAPMTHEAPHIPPYEQMEEWHRQDEEFDQKISALKMQINELRTLLARPGQHPHPGTEEVPGATQPMTDPAAQSELAKGPNFPVQNPSHPATTPTEHR